MTETRDTRHESRTLSDAGAQMGGLSQLDAWRLSDDLAVEVFRLTRGLPADLRWLGSQVLRAATSVPANIAEGYSRSSRREFLQFLSIARGSLTEVEYYLHFLRRAELIPADKHQAVAELRRRAGQTLFGLMRSTRAGLPRRQRSGRSTAGQVPEEYVVDSSA